MKEFKGQVAIITGAASGIGLAISRELINEGAFVSLLDINEEALKKEFKNYNSGTRLYAIDVTQQSLIDETIAKIIHDFGKIDILINCAGITGITNGLSHEVCTEDLHKVFE